MASRSQILPRAVFTRYAPRFILPMSSSSKRCSVSGWSGALIVTTSQTGTIDAASGWNVRPSSRSNSSGNRWRSVGGGPAREGRGPRLEGEEEGVNRGRDGGAEPRSSDCANRRYE